MGSASLALLKGGNKSEAATKDAPKAAAKEEPKKVAAAAETEAEETTIEVDVDAMDSDALDALVTENQIENLPKNWKKMDAPGKRTWLKSQFEETPVADENAGQTEEAPKADAKAAPAKKETKAKTPAKKAEVKADAKAGKEVVKAAEAEVLDPDELSDIVHTIENLQEKQAREMVGSLADEAEFSYFKLGGVLSVIQSNSWFSPYATFREFVEKEHGIHYRKAVYWVAIYNDLTEAKVPWEKVKGLGWTKLKEIASLLTPDNVDEWVKIAAGQTTLQLIETVLASKQANAPKALEDQASKNVMTKTFKVHEDQKATIEAAIDKAKKNSGTSYDTAALEFICLDYLGTGKEANLVELLKAQGLEEACNILNKAFPEYDFAVEQKAA